MPFKRIIIGKIAKLCLLVYGCAPHILITPQMCDTSHHHLSFSASTPT